MKLNRNNYEEYFILYLDNELDSEDRREVEVFAEANPDLKAELEMLLQSKLAPDTDITFDNKELLMIRNSSSISMINHEEWLLSYTDNELTGEERKDVEKFVAANPSLQTELNLLQQAKLQPEAIVFPYKESLYRREEKAKVIAIRWWTIAAAAVLLLGISTTAIVLLNNKKESTIKDGGIALDGKSKKVKSNNDTTVKQAGNVTPVNQVAIVGDEQKNIEPGVQLPKTSMVVKDKSTSVKEKKAPPVTEKNEEPVIAKTDKVNRSDNNLPQPTIENRYTSNAFKTGNTIAFVPNNEPALTKDKDNTHFADVTKEVPQPSYAFEQQSGNKGLRGFFRKVTRTIEKRTNFNKASDDDDRLLIAGLSIKTN